MFSAHNVHVLLSVAPVVNENVPTGHSVHTALPAALWVPGRHGRQFALDDAPGVLLLVPAGHGLTTTEYCALHDPRGEQTPEDALLLVFGEQSRHAVLEFAPNKLLYLPCCVEGWG